MSEKFPVSLMFPNGITVEVNRSPTDDEVLASVVIYASGFILRMENEGIADDERVAKMIEDQQETTGLPEAVCRWYVENTLIPNMLAFKALSNSRKDEIKAIANRMLNGDAPMRLSGAGAN